MSSVTKLSKKLRQVGHFAARSAASAFGVTGLNSGTCKSSASSVIAMANTASLNASSRRVVTFGGRGRARSFCGRDRMSTLLTSSRMETLKQHHDSPLEDVSAEDIIEAAASTRLWEGKHVTMPRFGPVGTDRRPRASVKAGTSEKTHKAKLTHKKMRIDRCWACYPSRTVVRPLPTARFSV